MQSSRTHSSLREGTRLGLVVATSIWLWLAAVDAVVGQPSLVMGVGFGFVIIEFGFAMLTVLLSHLGLGELAWVSILGGNLVVAAVASILLRRTHPLRRRLRAAEAQERE